MADEIKAPRRNGNKEDKGSPSSWATAATNALNHLATMGPDTFVFGLIVLVTFITMAMGVGLIAPLTGLAFARLYIYYRERLYKVQVNERFQKLDKGSADRAGKIIEATATPEEKQVLDNYAEKAHRLYEKRKARNDD